MGIEVIVDDLRAKKGLSRKRMFLVIIEAVDRDGALPGIGDMFQQRLDLARPRHVPWQLEAGRLSAE